MVLSIIRCTSCAWLGQRQHIFTAAEDFDIDAVASLSPSSSSSTTLINPWVLQSTSPSSVSPKSGTATRPTKLAIMNGAFILLPRTLWTAKSHARESSRTFSQGSEDIQPATSRRTDPITFPSRTATKPPPRFCIACTACAISASEVPRTTRFWFSQFVVHAIAPFCSPNPRTYAIPQFLVAWCLSITTTFRMSRSMSHSRGPEADAVKRE